MGTQEGFIPHPESEGGSPEHVRAELQMRNVRDVVRGWSEPFKGPPPFT